jgi:hypothetical protein
MPRFVPVMGCDSNSRINGVMSDGIVEITMRQWPTVT